MTELDDFDEAMPPHEVGLFMMVIGDRADLSEPQAITAGKAWRGALQHYPDATFDFSLSGYDDDPREIWGIPEAVRFVQWWAHYAGMDDFETARRVFGSDEYMCLGFLAMCGVFGEKLKQQVVFTT
jgi:hypothetical protein